ncbi:UNKNOWN [Stylonychia lemnae]|uniref:Uncharacterized protein n=1 Tax=Stylonychia lemnae TaxID=5949 RepID=A0A078A346_STYLE|nr:UNKNOWN [Stylonychia lemnae]|eukprot:CDW76587.1 UNKNOWN [Stylonychia lemnae]
MIIDTKGLACTEFIEAYKQLKDFVNKQVSGALRKDMIKIAILSKYEIFQVKNQTQDRQTELFAIRVILADLLLKTGALDLSKNLIGQIMNCINEVAQESITKAVNIQNALIKSNNQSSKIRFSDKLLSFSQTKFFENEENNYQKQSVFYPTLRMKQQKYLEYLLLQRELCLKLKKDQQAFYIYSIAKTFATEVFGNNSQELMSIDILTLIHNKAARTSKQSSKKMRKIQEQIDKSKNLNNSNQKTEGSGIHRIADFNINTIAYEQNNNSTIRKNNESFRNPMESQNSQTFRHVIQEIKEIQPVLVENLNNSSATRVPRRSQQILTDRVPQSELQQQFYPSIYQFQNPQSTSNQKVWHQSIQNNMKGANSRQNDGDSTQNQGSILKFKIDEKAFLKYKNRCFSNQNQNQQKDRRQQKSEFQESSLNDTPHHNNHAELQKNDQNKNIIQNFDQREFAIEVKDQAISIIDDHSITSEDDFQRDENQDSISRAQVNLSNNGDKSKTLVDFKNSSSILNQATNNCSIQLNDIQSNLQHQNIDLFMYNIGASKESNNSNLVIKNTPYEPELKVQLTGSLSIVKTNLKQNLNTEQLNLPSYLLESNSQRLEQHRNSAQNSNVFGENPDIPYTSDLEEEKQSMHQYNQGFIQRKSLEQNYLQHHNNHHSHKVPDTSYLGLNANNQAQQAQLEDLDNQNNSQVETSLRALHNVNDNITDIIPLDHHILEENLNEEEKFDIKTSTANNTQRNAFVNNRSSLFNSPNVAKLNRQQRNQITHTNLNDASESNLQNQRNTNHSRSDNLPYQASLEWNNLNSDVHNQQIQERITPLNLNQSDQELQVSQNQNTRESNNLLVIKIQSCDCQNCLKIQGEIKQLVKIQSYFRMWLQQNQMRLRQRNIDSKADTNQGKKMSTNSLILNQQNSIANLSNVPQISSMNFTLDEKITIQIKEQDEEQLEEDSLKKQDNALIRASPNNSYQNNQKHESMDTHADNSSPEEEAKIINFGDNDKPQKFGFEIAQINRQLDFKQTHSQQAPKISNIVIQRKNIGDKLTIEDITIPMKAANQQRRKTILKPDLNFHDQLEFDKSFNNKMRNNQLKANEEIQKMGVKQRIRARIRNALYRQYQQYQIEPLKVIKNKISNNINGKRIQLIHVFFKGKHMIQQIENGNISDIIQTKLINWRNINRFHLSGIKTDDFLDYYDYNHELQKIVKIIKFDKSLDEKQHENLLKKVAFAIGINNEQQKEVREVHQISVDDLATGLVHKVIHQAFARYKNKIKGSMNVWHTIAAQPAIDIGNLDTYLDHLLTWQIESDGTSYFLRARYNKFTRQIKIDTLIRKQFLIFDKPLEYIVQNVFPDILPNLVNFPNKKDQVWVDECLKVLKTCLPAIIYLDLQNKMISMKKIVKQQPSFQEKRDQLDYYQVMLKQDKPTTIERKKTGRMSQEFSQGISIFGINPTPPNLSPEISQQSLGQNTPIHGTNLKLGQYLNKQVSHSDENENTITIGIRKDPHRKSLAPQVSDQNQKKSEESIQYSLKLQETTYNIIYKVISMADGKYQLQATMIDDKGQPEDQIQDRDMAIKYKKIKDQDKDKDKEKEKEKEKFYLFKFSDIQRYITIFHAYISQPAICETITDVLTMIDKKHRIRFDEIENANDESY